MKHETNTNSSIAWYSAKQKVYIDNFGTFLSGTMTILHFSRRNCLPTSQRSLCVCILNWIESNFGWDWIKRYPYTSCLLLSIAWRFQRNFRFIFIFMFACSFCWSQVFDTIENQARCHIQWRCVYVCVSVSVCVGLDAFVFDGCSFFFPRLSLFHRLFQLIRYFWWFVFTQNLTFSTLCNGYCCIVTFDSWIHYYREIRLQLK